MPHADPLVRKDYHRNYKQLHRDRMRELGRNWRRTQTESDPTFRQRELEAERRYRARHPDRVQAKNKNVSAEKRREYSRRHAYGLEPTEYALLLQQQGGVCCICKKLRFFGNKNVLSVDHDHTSTVVRGLLCDYCNIGLGRFREDEFCILRAVLYLNSFCVEDSGSRYLPSYFKTHAGKKLYDCLLETQSNCCAICKRSNSDSRTKRKFLHMDHNHTTDQIRGLLCDACNNGIALFDENKEWLVRAADYLHDYRLSG